MFLSESILEKSPSFSIIFGIKSSLYLKSILNGIVLKIVVLLMLTFIALMLIVALPSRFGVTISLPVPSGFWYWFKTAKSHSANSSFEFVGVTE